MKRNLFIGVGGVILFFAGTYAGKASSRFFPMGMYYTAAGMCNKLDGCAAIPNIFVTAAPVGATTVAVVITVFGGRQKLFVTSKCKNVTYFNP
jgi:hypothetical protein